MVVTQIQDSSGAAEMARALAGERRIAMDCEAAGFHRYSDRLCLVQVSVDARTYLIDALAFDPTEALGPVLEDPGVQVIMHGADYDVRLLDRDLGIRPRGLFDTQIAAALVGEPALGLSALLEAHVGVRLSKKYQRADWAQRPLPRDMVEYAAADTAHLPVLADYLRSELGRRGRVAWADEEFRLLEQSRWEEKSPTDPVTRVKGAKALEPRALERLRRTLAWRDRIARQQDRAPFRVAGDAALVAVAVEPPRSVNALARVRGISPALARTEGRALLDELEVVKRLPEDELAPYPKRPRTGNGRPPPEVVERSDRLKAVRNRRADELGLDRGTLLPNGLVLELARFTPPVSAAQLSNVDGLRRWQLEAMGSVLQRALSGDGTT